MSLRSFLNLYASAALLGAAAFWWVAGSSMILNKRTSFSTVPHVKQSHLTSEPVKPGAYFERESRAVTPYSEQTLDRSPHLVLAATAALSRGVHHEPGSVALPGGRARAYPSSRTIERVIAACSVCGVPVGIGMRLVARESGFRQFDSRGRLLVSSAGAVGIGQIKPSSAAEVSPTLDIRDEWQNLVASMCYLSSRRGTWREKVLAYRVGASGIRTAAAHAYASHVMGSAN